MANTVDKVLKVARGEVGYLEKRNANNLYNKTANAGSNNYTKYGKEKHEAEAGTQVVLHSWRESGPVVPEEEYGTQLPEAAGEVERRHPLPVS